MKQTSKDKMITESVLQKTALARKLKQDDALEEAIVQYHRAIFLKEDPVLLGQLASIYEQMHDVSSAILFYKRAHQLAGAANFLEKTRTLSRIEGIQLLSIGSAKNILLDTTFEPFVKRYPAFHRKLIEKVQQDTALSGYILGCLAYLEVNQRSLAMSELQNCLMLADRDVDILVLRALISWSLLEQAKGYEQFWAAYAVDRSHPEIQLFLQMINPQLEQLFKEAKYHLIEKQMDKCSYKVNKALQMHPYHTQMLILSSYIHRSKENYELALSALETANRTLEDKSLESQLKNQISLTYNQMGIYLYKQGKYQEAATLFTEGIAFKDKDWGIFTNRGDCYRMLNDYVRALQEYLKAYEIESRNEDLNFRIACIYSMRGVALFNSKNIDLALNQFEQSLSYSPQCAQFHFSKAKCLVQLNRNSEAIAALEKCIVLDPKKIQAGQMLLELKDPKQRKVPTRKIIHLSKQK